jgi:hypothetical protein
MKVKPGTVILHSANDGLVPFSDSMELVQSSGLLLESLIAVGMEHRLADEESLAKMLEAVERNITPKNELPVWIEHLLRVGSYSCHCPDQKVPL